MQSILIGLSLALTALSGTLESTATYYATPAYAEMATSSLQIIQSTSTPYIKERIKHYAELYQVSEEVMNKVVQCESNYLPDALGDGGRSRGLVQIFKPAHPTISDEQAFDIEFSLNFLADNLSKGNGKLWTCYKMFYGKP
jgi:hypothetical protein